MRVDLLASVAICKIRMAAVIEVLKSVTNLGKLENSQIAKLNDLAYKAREDGYMSGC